jgi:hypothetical protein
MMQSEEAVPGWFVVVWIGIIWIVPIVVSYRIGVRKNRVGWLWGLLLGWLGVIILALLSPKRPAYRY